MTPTNAARRFIGSRFQFAAIVVIVATTHVSGAEEASFSDMPRIALDSLPYLGQKNAPIIVLEFSDYSCPYCRRHNAQTVPRLVRAYVDTGKIRYVFGDLPSRNPESATFKAANAALCAAEQKKYPEMRRTLYETWQRFKDTPLDFYTQSLKLDPAMFRECIDTKKYANRLRRTIRQADEAQIERIPTFYLGSVAPGDSDFLLVREIIVGSKSYNVFRDAIDAMLANTEIAPLHSLPP